MILLNIKVLHDFKITHDDARSQIESWEVEVKESQWSTPHELKRRYSKASIIKDKHVVFDFCWNKYRLWVQVDYRNGIVLVKKIGTHKEYDSWNIG